MLDCNPVSESVVAVEPEFNTMADHVAPPSTDLSILYPVIEEPPLLEGANQLRLICDDAAVATRFVGGCDTVVVIPASSVPTSLLKYDGTVSYGFDKTSFVIYR